MPDVPKATLANFSSACVAPEPCRRRWIEATSDQMAEKRDCIALDVTSFTARTCSVTNREEQERHPANYPADCAFGGLLRHALRRGGSAPYPPIGHGLDLAGTHQRGPDVTAENGTPLIAAAAGDTSVLAQAAPEGAVAACPKAVGSDTNDTRAAARPGSDFSALEKEVHAAAERDVTPLTCLEIAEAAEPRFDLGKSRIEAVEIACDAFLEGYHQKVSLHLMGCHAMHQAHYSH